VIHVQSVSDQSDTGIQLVSLSELNCKQSSSAAFGSTERILPAI